MLKTSVKVTLHVGDETLVFDDAVKAGVGTSVEDQLGHDIRIADYSDKGWFIREGCVCYAEVEKTTTDVPIVDATCV